jgi:hypothetical protein
MYVEPRSGELVPRKWSNAFPNFDNVGSSLLVCFITASLNGYTEVMIKVCDTNLQALRGLQLLCLAGRCCLLLRLPLGQHGLFAASHTIEFLLLLCFCCTQAMSAPDRKGEQPQMNTDTGAFFWQVHRNHFACGVAWKNRC